VGRADDRTSAAVDAEVRVDLVDDVTRARDRLRWATLRTGRAADTGLDDLVSQNVLSNAGGRKTAVAPSIGAPSRRAQGTGRLDAAWVMQRAGSWTTVVACRPYPLCECPLLARIA
jgi:hypothetical protein